MNESTEKCINKGNWIEMCDFLKKVVANQYGDIQEQVMRNRKTNKTRLRIVAGKFQKNRVQLNYCPFCGVDITTEYKEPSA